MIFLFAIQSVVIIVMLCVMAYFIVSSIDLLKEGPPFVKTRARLIDKVVNVLELQAGSRLVDLGCGDATVLVEAYKRFPQIQTIGIEKRLLPYLLSKWKTFRFPITIKFQNAWMTDISEATHIYCYSSLEFMKNLEHKVVTECATGTRIVSCDFPFPNLMPIQSINVTEDGDLLGKKLFVYKI